MKKILLAGACIGALVLTGCNGSGPSSSIPPSPQVTPVTPPNCTKDNTCAKVPGASSVYYNTESGKLSITAFNANVGGYKTYALESSQATESLLNALQNNPSSVTTKLDDSGLVEFYVDSVGVQMSQLSTISGGSLIIAVPSSGTVLRANANDERPSSIGTTSVTESSSSLIISVYASGRNIVVYNVTESKIIKTFQSPCESASITTVTSAYSPNSTLAGAVGCSNGAVVLVSRTESKNLLTQAKNNGYTPASISLLGLAQLSSADYAYWLDANKSLMRIAATPDGDNLPKPTSFYNVLSSESQTSKKQKVNFENVPTGVSNFVVTKDNNLFVVSGSAVYELPAGGITWSDATSLSGTAPFKLSYPNGKLTATDSKGDMTVVQSQTQN